MLTKVLRTLSGKLWKENSPYYEDALQQTWVYFCRNICEGETGEPYDPERASLATWLNAYLKRRLQDFAIAENAQKYLFTASPANVESADPLDFLAAPSEIPPILEEVRAWVQADPDGELRGMHLGGHPQITCQLLILRRLPPEQSWKALEAEFGIPVSTLSSFYRRQCLPRLRNFGQTQGYL